MMQKLLIRFLACLLIIVGTAGSSVASSGIAVTVLGFTMDTVDVHIGYRLTVNAQVRNTDSVLFSDVLDFGLRNSSSQITSPNVFRKPTYSGSQIVLNPDEVVPAVFSVYIDAPYFAPGPDVVVVWPVSNSPVTDSIEIYLNIENPNGIKQEERDDFTFLVLGNKILLQTMNANLKIQQVRIYNILGQQVSYLHSDFISEIPLPDTPRGIYICEMLASDKKTRVVKFYH